MRVIYDAVRLIFAAILVFALMLALVSLASYLNLFSYPMITGIAIGLLMVLGCIGALVFLNKRDKNRSGQISSEEHLRELESQGLISQEQFVALRAFEVEEFEDEGMHFFVELQDGRVLFLSGQYLYDYEPDAGRNSPTPRRFPCSEFTVRRHKTGMYVEDLVCSGIVIEPEGIAPPFSEHDWTEGIVPSDGEIITNMSYDELKKLRMSV